MGATGSWYMYCTRTRIIMYLSYGYLTYFLLYQKHECTATNKWNRTARSALAGLPSVRLASTASIGLHHKLPYGSLIVAQQSSTTPPCSSRRSTLNETETNAYSPFQLTFLHCVQAWSLFSRLSPWLLCRRSCSARSLVIPLLAFTACIHRN